MRIAGLALGVCLALVTPSSAPADMLHGARPGSFDEAFADSFDEGRAGAVEALIAELEAYVDWCSDAKLLAERDRAWTVVLTFDPENVEAHKGLGHKRDKDGTWKPNDKRKPPKDRDPEKLKEAPARWAQAVAPYRDTMLRLLDAHDAELSKARKRAVVAELLALNPNDAVLRERAGEVLVDGAWVLRETAAGKARRPEFKTLVAQAFADAPPPKPIQPDALEASLGVAWAEAWGTDLVRVLTTGEAAEAQRAVQAAHAAGKLYTALCGAPAQYPRELRLMLLASEVEKAPVLAAHPNIDEPTRRFFERLVGAWVPKSGDLCWWAESAPHRLDGVLRALFSWFQQNAYGLGIEIGWIHEGFGLYMTRTLVGTRLTWFVSPEERSSSAETQALVAKLYDSSVNWVNEGYLMLQTAQRPRLARFMKKETNALTAQEMLYSYVLAAYLLEGRPNEVPELLRRIGAGDEQDLVFQEVLGLTPDELDDRVLVWLSQRR